MDFRQNDTDYEIRKERTNERTVVFITTKSTTVHRL